MSLRSPDQRGHHVPKNKLDEGVINVAKCHIDSSPKASRSLVLKRFKKGYLEPIPNKTKIFELDCLPKFIAGKQHWFLHTKKRISAGVISTIYNQKRTGMRKNDTIYSLNVKMLQIKKKRETLYFGPKQSRILFIYKVAKNHGRCYIWSETEGIRGSNKIESCLMKFAENLPETITYPCFQIAALHRIETLLLQACYIK
nr:unnamed protein product [Callosobruchus analis]